MRMLATAKMRAGARTPSPEIPFQCPLKIVGRIAATERRGSRSLPAAQNRAPAAY
jgi:hypothetical protein